VSLKLPSWRSVDPTCLALAVVAGLWHAILMTRAANDNFMHMTLARQWLAGEWPVRDFFDQGLLLQFGLSAMAELVFGHRLLAEALVVGAAWAIATYLVFHVVRDLTGSRIAALAAGVLLIVAGARGYAYPKGIVYAGTALLWWGYQRTPTRAGMVALGAWVTLAFYWRPDHAFNVGVATALGVLLVHGVGRAALTHLAVAGATALVLVAPFLLYIQLVLGLPDYVRSGLVLVTAEHTTHGPHEWPLLRLPGRILVVGPAEPHAPTATLRWTPDSTSAAREDVLTRYGLTPTEIDGPTVRVRLSERALTDLRALIDEPIVEDTGGVDRSSAALDAPWPILERWRFRHAWLRLRLLPDLTPRERAAELGVALFYLIPLVAIAAAPWMRRHLPGVATGWQIAAFAAFALLVNLSMLRRPFPARLPDPVVLTAIVLALVVVWLWRAAGGFGPLRRGLVRTVATATVAATLTLTGATSGFFASMDELTGRWLSLERAGAAWGGLYRELVASPPLAHYRDRSARFSLRLAAYVRECTAPDDRLLVLWFEPEIYYYADRLIAQRHLIFAPEWVALDREQQMALDRIARFRPPIVLARRERGDIGARVSYPPVVEYVEREYHLAATPASGGDEYPIFVRRDRPASRTFEPEGWPCFTPMPTEWARVGRPAP